MIRARATSTGLGLAGLLLVAAGPAASDEMAFFVKNQHQRGMALELQAQDRQLRWPGGDQVYLIEPSMQKSIPIECTAGERICWAAWVVGDDRQSYGVGPDGDLACENCCVICVTKSTETVVLTPD